jgi:hypothetical protein
MSTMRHDVVSGFARGDAGVVMVQLTTSELEALTGRAGDEQFEGGLNQQTSSNACRRAQKTDSPSGFGSPGYGVVQARFRTE